MGGSARPLGGNPSSSSSAATCPQWDQNRQHPGAHMVRSAAARDLPCNTTRGWAHQGLLLLRGCRHLPLAPQQAPCSLMLVRLRLLGLPPPSQWSPLGCAASEKRKVFARKPPPLSVRGAEPQQGPRAWIYILGATRVGAS